MNERIKKLIPDNMKNKFSDLDGVLSKILIDLGIFPCRKGHIFLKTAIIYATANFTCCATVDIYKVVAGCCNCTERSVESGIRSALKAAYNFGKLIRINKLLGVEIMDSNDLLPNMQVISLIAHHCFYYIHGTADKQ